MPFSTNVPNSSQSPALFPAQANTNFIRIKAIVDADHNWLDATAVAEGAHNQVTLINRADPASVPSGTNSMFYGKAATDAINELWFYDGVTPRQVNWREVQGSGLSISSSSTYTTVAVVPDSSFGEIIMWANQGSYQIVVRGQFVCISGTCYAWSNPTSKSTSGSTSEYFIKFANSAGTSGTNIRARKESSASTLSWSSRVFARLI